MNSNNINNKNIICDNKNFIINDNNNNKKLVNKSTKLNHLNYKHDYIKKLFDTSKIYVFLRRNNSNLNFNDKKNKTNVNNNNNINFLFKRNLDNNLIYSKSKFSILNLNKNSLDENEIKEKFFPKKENNIKSIFSKNNKKSCYDNKTSRNKIFSFFKGKIFINKNNLTSSNKKFNLNKQNYNFSNSCNLDYKKLLSKNKITNNIYNLKFSLSTKYINNNIPDLFKNKKKNELNLYKINKFFMNKKQKVFKLK